MRFWEHDGRIVGVTHDESKLGGIYPELDLRRRD